MMLPHIKNPSKKRIKKRTPKKRPICDVHNDICELALDVMADVDDQISLQKDKRHIFKKLQKILDNAQEALQYGQKMEDRLMEYKNTIEDIGFKRKKP